MKIFRDYHNFYLNFDVLLLADCLERFFKLMKGKFGLDIAHYVSLLLFAEDALYKTTEQEIELFIDDNMYLFCKKANNPQCSNFVPELEEAMKKLYTWLLYIDANTLYTKAIMQSIPTGKHRWIMPDKTPDLFNKITNYILEVDLDYSYKLHKAYTSYPLAPENIKIFKEKMTKNDFEKNMYKLLGNANYRKTVENICKYQRIDFVRPEGESKKFKKLVADLSYKSHRILAENLVGISHHQSKAKLSKSIFISMSVLNE
ncbi:3943_t:CDS:2, partial [Racocetra fulgida]